MQLGQIERLCQLCYVQLRRFRRRVRACGLGIALRLGRAHLFSQTQQPLCRGWRAALGCGHRLGLVCIRRALLRRLGQRWQLDCAVACRLRALQRCLRLRPALVGRGGDLLCLCACLPLRLQRALQHRDHLLLALAGAHLLPGDATALARLGPLAVAPVAIVVAIRTLDAGAPRQVPPVARRRSLNHVAVALGARGVAAACGHAAVGPAPRRGRRRRPRRRAWRRRHLPT